MDALERERLAHTLRYLRRENGLRQIDLAVPGHVSRSTISALERGQIENPSQPLITAVATALGVHYEDLLALSDAESSVMVLLHEARRLWSTAPDKSIRAAQRVLIRSRRLHLDAVESDALKQLAAWYSHAGDAFRAGIYSAWLLARDGHTGSSDSAVATLGAHLHDMGEWRAAIALYRLLVIGIHPANPRSARVFLDLGQTYTAAHQYPHAVRMLGRAYRDAFTVGDANLAGWALVGLARALGFTGQYAQAHSANDRAETLAVTYKWTDLQNTILRTNEILSILSSDSVSAAQKRWHSITQRLQHNPEPLPDQINLLYSWINYASRHQAWPEVLAATEFGLGLIRSPDHVSNRGIKGQLLKTRAQANQQSGQPWKQDSEWAADLLRMDSFPTFDDRS